jgi:hypothetical protein
VETARANGATNKGGKPPTNPKTSVQQHPRLRKRRAKRNEKTAV